MVQVCFERNVHQREADNISDLAALFEPTPKLYTQLVVDSLFDLPKAAKVPPHCSLKYGTHGLPAIPRSCRAAGLFSEAAGEIRLNATLGPPSAAG